MARTFYVDCPFCQGVLEIDSESGAVVAKWAASEKKDGGGDRMADALRKIQEGKKRRENLFAAKKDEMDDQKKRLSDTFRKNVERAKEEGPDDKPLRPFDLD